MRNRSLAFVFLVAAMPLAIAQSADQSTQQSPGTNYQVEQLPQTPVYRVTVTARSTEAINYRGHNGNTKIDFAGSRLAPEAYGDAKIESHTNGLGISASFYNLPPARSFGPEYLTYVLWAITPEGRAQNLGELPMVGDRAALHVTTDLQAFGLIVTAEPYFAVTRPSDIVVAENQVRRDTKGWEQPIDTKFDAVERGEYTADLNAADLPASVPSNKPLDLLEAENAVAVARATGAATYAPETLAKAQQFLQQGEIYYTQGQDKQAIATVTRGAAQQAEDARLLTIRRKQVEQAQQQQQQVQDAQLQAQQEQQQRMEAERAREHAERQQQQAAAEAQQARSVAQQAQQQSEQMRQRLLQQLNTVMETQATARGLIVNMPDVLFDTGQSTLKPAARERLAKVAGIVQTYPDLQLQVEGYTDSTGTPEVNQKLSDARADAVRSYLVSQGVSRDNIAAQGYGEEDPVASNETSDGRRLNRRVQLVVNGTAIGSAYAAPAPTSASAVSTTTVQRTTTTTYDSSGAPTASSTTVTTQPGSVPSTPAAVEPNVQPNAGISQPPQQ
jgi:outer membrane protein OmpA-like peptidoglycan-associated protein